MTGLSDIAPGDSIAIHKHLGEEEILFIHRGTADVTLGEETRRAGAGATVFIPRGTWIGLRAVGPDTVTTVFVFNKPAFEKCLRARSVRPGERYVPPSGRALEALQRECHQVRKSG
jgi:quercetin dioxygenase-like cupin family protein